MDLEPRSVRFSLTTLLSETTAMRGEEEEKRRMASSHWDWGRPGTHLVNVDRRRMKY